MVFGYIPCEDINRITELCPNQAINTEIFAFHAGTVVFDDPTRIAGFRGCAMELRDWVILLGTIAIALAAINIRLLSKYVYKLEDRIKALEEKEN
mgnify:CR=1 FL=1